jgi:hypothetical protein
MTSLIIITTISILFASIWLLKKPKTKYLENILRKIHFAFLTLAILTIGLLVGRLRFFGLFTNSAIGLIFLTSGILLFGLTTSKIIKIYTGLIAIPTLVTEISFLLFGISPFLFPAFIGYFMFAAPIKKEKINDKYSVEIYQGGPFAPPNIFYLTKRTSVIFDRQIRLESSENFLNISKFEVIGFKENENVTCKIYIEGNPDNYIVDTLQYSKDYGD